MNLQPDTEIIINCQIVHKRFGISCSTKHEKTSSSEFDDANISSKKDKSRRSVFITSPWQLTTVTLDFHQIRTMACVSSGFRSTLMLLAFFVASQALAKPGNNANSTLVSSKTIKQCNKVYNNFYHTAGPNKKIEVLLQEMKKQLIHVEDDINILKGNKTIERG